MLLHQKTSRKCLRISPLKIGVFMIILVMVWGMTLFTTAQWRPDHQVKESDLLKSKIVQLSKEYINVLAKEKDNSLQGINTLNHWFVYMLLMLSWL